MFLLHVPPGDVEVSKPQTTEGLFQPCRRIFNPSISTDSWISIVPSCSVSRKTELVRAFGVTERACCFRGGTLSPQGTLTVTAAGYFTFTPLLKTAPTLPRLRQLGHLLYSPLSACSRPVPVTSEVKSGCPFPSLASAPQRCRQSHAGPAVPGQSSLCRFAPVPGPELRSSTQTRFSSFHLPLQDALGCACLGPPDELSGRGLGPCATVCQGQSLKSSALHLLSTSSRFWGPVAHVSHLGKERRWGFWFPGTQPIFPAAAASRRLRQRLGCPESVSLRGQAPPGRSDCSPPRHSWNTSADHSYRANHTQNCWSGGQQRWDGLKGGGKGLSWSSADGGTL